MTGLNFAKRCVIVGNGNQKKGFCFWKYWDNTNFCEYSYSICKNGSVTENANFKDGSSNYLSDTPESAYSVCIDDRVYWRTSVTMWSGYAFYCACGNNQRAVGITKQGGFWQRIKLFRDFFKKTHLVVKQKRNCRICLTATACWRKGKNLRAMHS